MPNKSKSNYGIRNPQQQQSQQPFLGLGQNNFTLRHGIVGALCDPTPRGGASKSNHHLQQQFSNKTTWRRGRILVERQSRGGLFQSRRERSYSAGGTIGGGNGGAIRDNGSGSGGDGVEQVLGYGNSASIGETTPQSDRRIPGPSGENSSPRSTSTQQRHPGVVATAIFDRTDGFGVISPGNTQAFDA